MKPSVSRVGRVGLLVLLAACGDDGGHGGNPGRLWIATDGSEVNLKLQDTEPAPF
ncbi:MAG TPA: hypothetical protein VGM90_32530 [Kofleriaceae bacterium]|jgi:hypothetical protein